MSNEDSIYKEMLKNMKEIYALKKVASIENLKLSIAGFDLLRPFKVFNNPRLDDMFWENIIYNDELYKPSSPINKRAAKSTAKCFYFALASHGRSKSPQVKNLEDAIKSKGYGITSIWDNQISKHMYDAATYHDKKSAHHRSVSSNVEDPDSFIKDEHLTLGNKDWRQVNLKDQSISGEKFVSFIDSRMKDILREYNIPNESRENLHRLRLTLEEKEKKSIGMEREKLKNELSILHMFERLGDLRNLGSKAPTITKENLYGYQSRENMINQVDTNLRRRSLSQAFSDDSEREGRYKLYLTYEFEDDPNKIESGFEGLKLLLKNIIINLSIKENLDRFEKHVSLKTSAEATSVVQHLDSIVIYFYTENDRKIGLDIVNRVAAKINPIISSDDRYSGKLLDPSERENKYVRSALGNDLSYDGGKGGSDTSAFCEVAAAYIFSNMSTLCPNLRSSQTFNDFVYEICKNLEPLYNKYWSSLSYTEKIDIHKKASGYLD